MPQQSLIGRTERTRTGFTLIELLVVITIIVVLIALLTPAMERAVEQAQRAACAARLHAWGIAVPQYSLENKRRLLSSVRHNSTTADAVYPNLAWGRIVTPPNQYTGFGTAKTQGADLSAEAMLPYTPGGDLSQNLFSKMWYCPSNSAALKESNNAATVTLGGWFHTDYAYFARADIWGQTNATFPQELVGTDLAGGRLLMADTIYRWNPQPQPWWFNHGIDGWSTHDTLWGGPVQLDPNITGTNRLTGDGAVGWKNVSPDEIERMNNPLPDDDLRWVSNRKNASKADGDLNFY